MSGTVRLALLVLRMYLFTLVGLLVYKFITVCEAGAILSKHELLALRHRPRNGASALALRAQPDPRSAQSKPAARPRCSRSPLQPEQARSRPPGPALRRLAGIYKRRSAAPQLAACLMPPRQLIELAYRHQITGNSCLTHSFSTRREVFFQRAPGTCILLEDDIGFGGPLEGLRFGVVLGEPGLDAASSSATLLNTPRRICWRVISANSRSTRLIQDDDVGVKCSLKRGCLASQACTSLVLWVL